MDPTSHAPSSPRGTPKAPLGTEGDPWHGLPASACDLQVFRVQGTSLEATEAPYEETELFLDHESRV